MQLKNGEIYKMNEHLSKLEKVDVPARVGIHVARLVKRLAAATREINLVINDLVIKYGELNDKGVSQISAESANWPVFQEEYNGLMEEETDIESNKVMLPAETAIPVKLLMVFEPFLAVAE